MLDCPLSGTGAQAVTKDLVVFASGDQAAAQKCQTVFDHMSRETQYVGAFGNGMKMKLVANLLVAIHNVAAAEAIVMARKAGLDAKIDLRCSQDQRSDIAHARSSRTIDG